MAGHSAVNPQAGGSGEQIPRIYIQRIRDPNERPQRDVRVASLDLLPEPPVNPDRLHRGDGGELLLLTQAPHVGCDSASKPMLAPSDTALPHAPTLGGRGAMPLRLVGRTPLEAQRSGAYLWIMVAPSENLASSDLAAEIGSSQGDERGDAGPPYAPGRPPTGRGCGGLGRDDHKRSLGGTIVGVALDSCGDGKSGVSPQGWSFRKWHR